MNLITKWSAKDRKWTYPKSPQRQSDEFQGVIPTQQLIVADDIQLWNKTEN